MGSGFDAGFAFAQGGGIQKFFQGLGGAASSYTAHNGSGFSNIMCRLFVGKSADEMFNPNFVGSAMHGLDGLSIVSGSFVAQLSHVDQVFGISTNIHTPSLDTPLFGTPKR